LKTDPENIYHRELHTLLKFSALINSSLEIESVLDTAMKFSEEFINAEASSIFELDEEKDELFIRVARGEKKDSIKKVRLKVGEGIAGWVAKTGEPMVVQDTTKEEKFSKKYDQMSGFKTRSLICVPLMLRDKPVGAIQVLNKKNLEPFTDADLEILISLSQQIAVALEKAKLYSRLEKKFELTAQELKTTQEKLLRTERLASMGNLVNGIAHEIRNPIMTIGGFASRIKDSTCDNMGLQKYINIILSETMRLENIVKKVNEFLEVQSAAIKPDEIEPVFNYVFEKFSTLAEKQGVQTVMSIADDLPMIEMDRQQITTALSNIIENAIEAMHNGGKMELFAGVEDNRYIKITLKDTGAGIAEESLDSVYDPFVTSKASGIGLGLTMVYQIIKNHDGEIEISSKKAEGTTVTITLPLRHEQRDVANGFISEKGLFQGQNHQPSQSC
jgi:signal transduction histidine kinase